MVEWIKWNTYSLLNSWNGERSPWHITRHCSCSSPSPSSPLYIHSWSNHHNNTGCEMNASQRIWLQLVGHNYIMRCVHKEIRRLAIPFDRIDKIYHCASRNRFFPLKRANFPVLFRMKIRVVVVVFYKNYYPSFRNCNYRANISCRWMCYWKISRWINYGSPEYDNLGVFCRMLQ